MSNEQNSPSKKRMRSPAYPSIDLAEAIEKASVVWKKDRNHETQLKSLSDHWGFNPASSSVLAKTAALKHFGLLDEVKGGTPGAVKLSDLAVKILANEGLESDDRIALVKKAALTPAIYAELWTKYGGQLPSDVTIRTYLIGDRAFNPDVVNGLLKNFRDTISFAKLEIGDSVPEDNAKEQPNMTSPPPPRSSPPPPRPPVRSTDPLGQFVYPKPADQPPDILAPPPRPIARGSNLSLPLGNGDFVVIPKMSKDDFDLFLETLKLWEKKLILAPPPKESFPFIVMWKNKDFDKIVKIVGSMGDLDGEKYYQSEDGTGIPASELFPDALK